MSTDYQAIDYTTHILIGVRAGGVMTVLADWPYVPLQAEVQKEIACTRAPYVVRAVHADVGHARRSQCLRSARACTEEAGPSLDARPISQLLSFSC